MRKIFSFRSSGSSNGSNNPAPPSNRVNWEKPSRNKLKTDVGNRSQRNSHSLKDFSTRPRKYGKSCESGLRRSLSFSSPITYCGPQRHMDSSDASISPTTSNYPHQDYNYAIWGRSLSPERISKTKRVDQVEVLERVEKFGSSGASTGYADSSWHSTNDSPVPLKCRAPRITQIPNKVLDRYIDGEQPERISRPKTEPCQMNSVLSGQDDFPIENRVRPHSSYPPLVQGKGPAFQKECHEHLNSHKFVGDVYLQNFGDWARDEAQPSSSQRLARSVIERLAESFPEKCGIESQDFNNETSTIVEDIYEEYPETHPVTYANEFHHSSQSSDARNGAAYRYPIKVSSTLKEETMFAGDDPECLHYELSHLQEQVEVDMELQRKGQEVQQRVLRLFKQLEEGKVTHVNIICEMRYLVFEVLGQIQSRMAERASAGKAVKQAKIDFDSRIKRLEEEKNEFQASLGKELDRRSREWSFKLEQFQLEERRLRERVRELAEQNISLQREVASTNGKDMDSITRILDLESQLNNATSRMEEMGSDNCKLQAVVSELQDQLKHAESDRDSIVGSYKEKETATKDLHKAVARLQRIYNEQDKTISGLQQGLFEKISTQPSEKCDGLVKLQLEQVRLTSVEQNLRKEIEHYNIEINALRQENITLLDRLNGGRSSSFRLEEELKERVNYFESRCFSLLKEASRISEKLLTLVRMSHINEGIKKGEVKSGVEEFVLLEYDMKFQCFGRDVENFKRGLQTLYSILQEKADADASEFRVEGSHGRVLKEDQVESELKAEILLTKALREKLHSQELELEKLEADLATSVRCNDILRCEVQRAQDAFSSLTHRMKDLELQMMRKNENINQLQMDLKDNMRELTGVQSMLTKVSGERDLMWEEVKQYSEKNMLLNCEVASLRKKIEALDEDILLKEGQITILKDSLKEKPFDIFYGTNSLKGCLFNEPF